MATPIISVVMPVYNCEPFIKEAIDSILAQTFTDFELIIIDDGSTDKTTEITESYDDLRIRLVKKDKNTGITDCLNLGLEMARGEFIARMDGDDISHPERLAKQIKVLKENPSLILVGTCFSIIDGRTLRCNPLLHDEIKVHLLHHNYIQHPTVLMRKDLLDRYQLRYDKTFETAEDYKFWTDITQVGEVRVMEDHLLQYRVHEQQTSSVKAKLQEEKADAVRLLLLHRLLRRTVSDAEANIHLQLIKTDYSKDLSLRKFEFWIGELLKANQNAKIYNPNILRRFLIKRQMILAELYFGRNKYYEKGNCWHFYRHLPRYWDFLSSKNFIKLFLKVVFRGLLTNFSRDSQMKPA